MNQRCNFGIQSFSFRCFFGIQRLLRITTRIVYKKGFFYQCQDDEFFINFAILKSARLYNPCRYCFLKTWLLSQIFEITDFLEWLKYLNLSHYSFLSLEIRFFEKIGFLNPRLILLKNKRFLFMVPHFWIVG